MPAKNKMMQKWWEELKSNKSNLFFSIVFLVISTIINIASGKYADSVGLSTTSDLVLDHIPSTNLGFIFVWVWIFAIILLFFYPLIKRVNKLHDVIYYFSIVTTVRSIFVSLTHLKAPMDAIPIVFPTPLNYLSFQNDLFFSGHTAIPLVGFFVFKGEKIRYVFLGVSILMAFTVLAMHQHYSIDVFAAYFIVYGTYKMGEWLRQKINLPA